MGWTDPSLPHTEEVWYSETDRQRVPCQSLLFTEMETWDPLVEKGTL